MHRRRNQDGREGPTTWTIRALLLVAVLVAAFVARTGSTGADATPVGALPKGPVTTVVAPRGSLVALALPRQRPASGLVWRLARSVNHKVLSQVSEGDVGRSVVVVFRARATGSARVVFALTRGESGTKALRAVTHSVRVR